MELKPLNTLDNDLILLLNQDHKRETSSLNHAELETMVSNACYAYGIAPAQAFLIAFDDSATYSSPNFTWFQDRYSSFVYIDRIITAENARGKGLARALYEDLFKKTRASGRDTIACEVNIDPPNPGSDAFHARMGFEQVGTAVLKNGKLVRYMVKKLL